MENNGRLLYTKWPSTDGAIYRGPLGYAMEGSDPYKVCKLLENSFGGLSCGVNDLAQRVCREDCDKASKTKLMQEASTCFEGFFTMVDKLRAKHGGPYKGNATF